MFGVSKPILQTIVRNMIKREINKWPPDSLGAYYQPVRPEKEQKSQNIEKPN